MHGSSSGEPVERFVKRQDGLSVVTIVMHWFHHTHIGVSNDVCAIKAKVIRIQSELLFSKDCAVEAGYQVARNQCMGL